MANSLFSWLIAFGAVYPIGMTLMNIGHKPVDVVLSDLLFIFVLLTPSRGLLRIPEGVNLKRLAIVRIAAIVMIAYCIATSLIGYAMSSEMSRILSATKFLKPMMFVPLGVYLATLFPPLVLLRRIAIAFGVMMVITFATTVTTPGFPRCHWGSHFFSQVIYGYRNCSMTFNGVLVPLLIALGDSSKNGLMRKVFFGVAAMTAMMVIFSMARSSMLSMTVAVIVYYVVTKRWHVPAFATGLALFLALAGFGLMNLENEVIAELRNRIEIRYLETIEGGDGFSGRTDIWWYTIELAADRPVFGYLFEPYSNYSPTYDTPHQQYLEVLYKTGLVGCALYALLLGSGIAGLLHLKRHAPVKSDGFYLLGALLAAVVATMFGNLSQPNLTYSLLGNLLFLLLGLTLNRQTAAGLIRVPATLDSAVSPTNRLPSLAITPQ